MRPFGYKDKFGYLFGDFGNDFFFALVASFLMVYYTDVFHIHPAAVGVVPVSTLMGCRSGYYLGAFY